MTGQRAGLMDSVRRLASTLILIVSTRLELLGNELEAERLRLMQMLIFALSALFCFGMGVLMLTVFIAVLFWDDHRLAVLGGLSTLFFVLGMVMAMLLRNKSQSKAILFSTSLAELAKDRKQLGDGHE